jgi:hypothetical protein
MKGSVVLVLAVISAIPFTGYSQSFYAIRRHRNFLVSFGSGTANYKGEMVNPGEYVTPILAARSFRVSTDGRFIRNALHVTRQAAKMQ